MCACRLAAPFQDFTIACNLASGHRETLKSARHPARYGGIKAYSEIEPRGGANGEGPRLADGKIDASAAETEFPNVAVSYHFLPLQGQPAGYSGAMPNS